MRRLHMARAFARQRACTTLSSRPPTVRRCLLPCAPALSSLSGSDPPTPQTAVLGRSPRWKASWAEGDPSRLPEPCCIIVSREGLSSELPACASSTALSCRQSHAAQSLAGQTDCPRQLAEALPQ